MAFGVEQIGGRIVITFDGDSKEESKVLRGAKGRSKLDAIEDYVVIDIETTGLDPRFDEIIELAAINVEKGIVVDTFNSLVKPENKIDEFIEKLTGITNEMVSSAPNIKTVLPAFVKFIGEKVVVGHNVNFDINFIYDESMNVLGQPFSNDFIDTMRMSRRLYPEERHHRLSDLEKRFDLENDASHRALSDAKVTDNCYKYMLAYMEEKGITCNDLKSSGNNHESDCRAKNITTKKTEFDESSDFYQQTFAFTGTLQRMIRKDAMQIVVDRGGFVGDGVTKKTNYLVLGNLDYAANVTGGKSSKMKKAEGLMLSGSDIKIISEDIFYEMIEAEEF